MVIAYHSPEPFEVIHRDFAKIKKRGEGISKTQAFLVVIGECTRMAATKPEKEDANSVLTLLERNMFKNTNVVVSDNGPAFRSKKLQEWARERGIPLRFAAPYHPEGYGLAERRIRDLKTFIAMHPDLRGGWKCTLEAAVRHHNLSHIMGLGCTPNFAASGETTWLPADDNLAIAGKLEPQEKRKTEEELIRYRSTMKRHYDMRHSSKMPLI